MFMASKILLWAIYTKKKTKIAPTMSAIISKKLHIRLCNLYLPVRLLKWPVRKADNLTTILFRCHVIWEP